MKDDLQTIKLPNYKNKNTTFNSFSKSETIIKYINSIYDFRF